MIKSVNYLCRILECEREELEEIIDNIDYYYYEFSEIKYNRNTGKPKVKNGVVQKRYFNPSRKRLKHLQNKLQHKVLSKIPLLANIKGGVKGCGNIDNAKEHKGNKYRFQTDLTNFFPSVSSEMVFYALRGKGFSKKVAEIITDLTTFKTKDSWRNKCTPQGAPTSPTLANLVFERIDKQILELIDETEITYTRWIDDLTFSSKIDFRKICPSILQIIGNNGFKISKPKTTYRKNKSVITGVVVGISTMKITKDFRNKDESNMTELQKLGRLAYKEQIYKTDKKKPVANKELS